MQSNTTKDNWIKAFDEKFGYVLEDVLLEKAIKSFISQVEKDAIEKRTKLLEESFKHRTKPVINLDEEDKNCEVCGYDHDSMTEANENAYKVAHLKIELSQATQKTNKRCIKKILNWIDEQHKDDKPWDGGTYMRVIDEFKLRDYLSDLLEDKRPYFPDIPPVIIKKAVRVK